MFVPGRLSERERRRVIKIPISPVTHIMSDTLRLPPHSTLTIGKGSNLTFDRQNNAVVCFVFDFFGGRTVALVLSVISCSK